MHSLDLLGVRLGNPRPLCAPEAETVGPGKESTVRWSDPDRRSQRVDEVRISRLAPRRLSHQRSTRTDTQLSNQVYLHWRSADIGPLLLVTQRLDGVQLRGLGGWQYAEHDANGG